MKRINTYLALAAILLLATFFRAYRLRTMPWGLAQDEVLNIDVATYVLDGYRPIFFPQGYGHEPLFHYLSAGTVALWGENVAGIRLPAVFGGLLLIALAYVLARRLFDAPAAWTVTLGLSVSWWPTIFSRLGIRAITLPVVTTLGVYGLSRALAQQSGKSKQWWGLAGLGLGLTWYTYTAGRVLPLLLPLLVGYLALTNRPALRRHGAGLALSIIVALLTITPLGLYLRAHPGSDQRIEQLDEPLERLRQGDPSLVWESTRATLGMFSLSGDSRWTYGLQGRPTFEPLGAALFYLGLVLCLARWRQPACALLLLWLGLGLAPGMIAPESPSMIRTIGALPVVYLLPGVAVSFLWEQARRPALRRGLVAGLLLVASVNAVWTYRDGFERWASHAETYWLYKAHFADIAAHLNAQTTPRPVVISENWYDPIDAGGLYRHLQRQAQVRWTQQELAFIFPVGAAQFEIAVTPYSPPRGELWRLFAANAPLAATSGASQFKAPVQGDKGKFHVSFYTLTTSALQTHVTSAAAMPVSLPDGGPALTPPLTLGQQFNLLGYELLTPGVRPGGQLTLLTLWQTLQDAPPPTAIFVHLLDPDGQLCCQHDGLDVDLGSLQQGDIIAQLHTIPIPPDASAGDYRLQLGLYTRADQVRLPVFVDGQAASDRLWLTLVELKQD